MFVKGQYRDQMDLFEKSATIKWLGLVKTWIRSRFLRTPVTVWAELTWSMESQFFIQLIHFINLIEIVFSPVYDTNESYTRIIFKVNLKLKCFENK